jgi:glycosyltransferase involved in cell wall biosynthesis
MKFNNNSSLVLRNQLNTYTLPKISIVTPSYNQGKFLRETIESVLNQDYPNLEYFIIDGGSTDNSIEIIHEYKDRVDWWVSEKDNGQSGAINRGFMKSTGDLFNWINSDDILFPGALFRIAAAFEQNPHADLIVGDQARGDAKGRIFHVSCAPSHLAISPTNWVFPFGQQSTFIATKAFKRAGGTREDLHGIMDSDLYYRILTSGGVFARAQGMVGMIRTHPLSKGENRKDIWLKENSKIWNEYGISQKMIKIAEWRMRFLRCIDGSYVHSFLKTQKWRGKKPWGG